ncbi:short-chain dehydrogenase [Pseudidiomarina salinarum]|uniref:Short-chain dehydrogenase n=1 Tax=Pseudidiomarina salinarum TaxID=435908 RepID=A0A094JHE8_9GAMM|nr:SDR family NAD(P)-dependent oxidoreductase [Pseudidiomarina salinarum]KFZ31981.1 short-chain dehydrogenase [Pseudidiomarina salinarum]RUO70242.1 short-chain dehydrogenase [Pseudidiomarina salinarum]
MNILITGGTSGIGRQLAMDYAEAGHNVIVCGRTEAALHELQERYPKQIAGQQLDVTDAEATLQALRSYIDIDLVILSAGVAEYVDIENFNTALFERVYEVNVFGTVRCIEAVLPNLKRGSKLVIVGSTARLLPFTRAEAYASSKAALHYIARSLQVDLADRGIKVLTVSPGFVKTPMTDKNDFEMPMRVSVEFASKSIRRGIEKNKTDISFPRIFSFFLKFMALLPQRCQVAISKRLA